MLETAIGVFGGLILFSLFNGLLAVPKTIRRNRERKEFYGAVKNLADEVFERVKEQENAERAKANQSRKGTAKTAGSRASKTGTRSQSGRRNSNTNGKVQSGRKGTSKKA